MRKLVLPLILLFTPLIPLSVSSQQINNFGVCTQYREIYTPGGYDYNGNYYSGGVRVESFNVPCNTMNNINSVPPYRPYYRYGYYNCNPTRTLLGATLGGAIGYGVSNRRNRGWATALGASIGGLAFVC